jgi:hypothetical protein
MMINANDNGSGNKDNDNSTWQQRHVVAKPCCGSGGCSSGGSFGVYLFIYLRGNETLPPYIL